MGNSVDQELTQWSNGDFVGSTNTEDDLAIITTSWMSPIRDDHGDAAWSSTIVTPSTELTGMVGAGGDVDTFLTSVDAGPITASVRAATADTTNLFASVTIRDLAGNVLATNTPTAITKIWGAPVPRPLDWTAAVTVTVPAGVYTVEVAPAGLNPGALTGFSAYGAHGGYVLSLDAVAPPSGTPAPARPPAPRTPPGEDSTIPVRFSPVAPARLVDTRDGAPGAARLDPGEILRVQVAGRFGVPADASAAAMNVVAVDASSAGYLTAYPCADTVPPVATVNHAPGTTLANATIATLSPDGAVCVFAYSEVDVVIDLTGWFSPNADHAMSLHSERVLDTRTGAGGAFRASAGSVTAVQVPGSPAAVALNVTAVNPAAAGYLTLFPCGSERPFVAGVNFTAGEIRPNNAIVAAGRAGTVCIYSYAETDIVVDVTGVFSPSGSYWYLPAAPTRLYDSRVGGTPARPGQPISYQTPPAPSATAGAISVNLAATEHTKAGFVTTFDCADRPDTAALSTQVGETNSNGAIAPVLSYRSCLSSYSRTHLIVDLLGWWV